MLVAGVVTRARARWWRAGEQRRAQQAAGFAGARGWSYTRSSEEHGHRYLGFPCGGAPGEEGGGEAHAEHVMQGAYRGQQVTVAEHVRLHTAADGAVTSVRCLVAGVALSTRRPTVQLEARRRAQPGTGRLALQDVSLGRRDLDRAFRVSTDDPAFARAVLGERTAGWMLHDPRFAHVPLRFERADLVTWRPGPLRLPLVLPLVLPLLDVLVEVRERVPTTLYP